MNREPCSRPAPGPRRRAIRELLLRAAIVAGGFLVVHALGFRRYASILSGTDAFGAAGNLFGVLYVVAWLAFTMLMPILLIAAFLLLAGDVGRGLRRRRNPARP